MNFLFNRRFIISSTIIILLCVFVSIIYQVFFLDSKEKKISQAVSKSEIVRYEDSFEEKICDLRKEHDYFIHIFCNYESGRYFGIENSSNYVENEINSFVKLGETVLKKEALDSIVKFINKLDTLTIVYKVNKKTRVLNEGVIW